MSALAQSQNLTNSTTNSITSISANARIDYILRFSKQAVLVVDNNPSVYAQIASEFVANLPENHNAALIALSPRHNDIQIRCRLIEQLFGSVLFDPEQSLAVSILNLAKNSQEAISVVIEHTHLLSLQLNHELCQLVDAAKKTTILVNVLLLGEVEAGNVIAKNKESFQGKLSIITADSGQLVPLNSKLFSSHSRSLSRVIRIIFWMTIISLVIAAGAWSAMQYYEKMSRESILNPDSNLNTAKKQASTFVLPSDKVESNDGAAPVDGSKELPTVEAQVLQASPQDVFNALQSPASNNSLNTNRAIDKQQAYTDKVAKIKAENAQLLAAIKQRESSLIPSKSISDSLVKPSTSLPQNDKAISSEEEKFDEMFNYIDSNYYQALESGFVIQFSGFTQPNVYQEYINTYPELSHKAYIRMVNGEKMLMMTSLVYTSRVLAEDALENLSITIKETGVWVKSVQAINSEINAFNTAIR